MTLNALTSWALVGLAGGEDREARWEFARRYDKFVRRVLAKRWLGSPYRTYFDDAIQEVFVECFKSEGVIAKADPKQGNSFRTLLFRVTCNVAARFERRHARDFMGRFQDFTTDVTSEEESALAQLTRDEATDVVREALRRTAMHPDPDVRERGKLLIDHTCYDKKIIHLANGDAQLAAGLHRDHTRAKKEFQSMLFEVVQSMYHVPVEDVLPIVRELFDHMG